MVVGRFLFGIGIGLVMESLVTVDTAHYLAYDHTHFFMRPYVLFWGQNKDMMLM
jgi:hypothetical protein